MTVYYVNALTGSDANTGSSESGALASLQAVNNLKLTSGDSVLFSADSVFEGQQLTVKYSGREGSPITFGSYGEGPGPVLSGGDVGIYGSKTSYIVIENLTITHTVGNAIYAGSASHWVIDNVTVTDTGSESRAGSISLQSSRDMAVVNSTMTGVHYEGLWMKGVDGAVILNNTVINSIGHDADAIQLNDSANIIIRDNTLDMTGQNGSAKGVLVLVNAHGAVIEGNVMTGGGFGLSVHGEEIVVQGNEISGFGGYNWSYGIGLGQKVDAKNYMITDNYIHDGVWGVSVSGSGVDTLKRENIEISGNIFEDLSKSALKVDRAASGSFHDNIVETGVNTALISPAVAALNSFSIGLTEQVADVHALADQLLGRVTEAPTVAQEVPQLDNVATDTVTPPVIAQPEPTPHSEAPVFQPPGVVVPELVTPPVVSEPEPATEPPTPLIEVPQVVPNAPIVLSPVTGEVVTPVETSVGSEPNGTSVVANNDAVVVNSQSGLIVTGNVFDNDHSSNGIMSVRSFGGIRLGTEGLTLEGKYGTAHISADGDFTYSVHADSVPDSTAPLVENFQYKVSNGVQMDVGSLAIKIDGHSLAALGKPDPSASEPSTTPSAPAFQPTTPVIVADETPLVILPKDNSMVANSDRVHADAQSGLVITGNVLDNDHSGNDVISLKSFGGIRLGNDGLTLEGKHGSAHIDSHGDFTYSIDLDSLASSTNLRDSFQYKVSNGFQMDVGSLVVEIDSHSLLTQYAVDGMLL